MSEEVKRKVEIDYALVILIKEILSQLDEVAALRRRGNPASISSLMLNEMCGVLKELEPELAERYFDILVKTTSKIDKPFKINPNDEYISASQNARRRTISMIRQTLFQDAA